MRSLQGNTECKAEWAAYEQESKRVKALAAELGPVAAQCHSAHSAYDQAVSDREAAVANAAQCKEAHAVYGAQKSAVLKHSLCEAARHNHAETKKKYEQTKAAHASAVAKTIAENNERQAAYEKKLAEVNRQNTIISATNAGKMRDYESKLAAWKIAYGKYQQYRAAVGGMARGYSMGWSRKLAQSSNEWMRKYDWNYMTSMCGTRVRCMTQKAKDYYYPRCVVVKGLSGTAASICQVRKYYPTCPSCPTYAPNPGSAPTKPTLQAKLALPKAPVKIVPISWDDFNKGFGAKPPGPTPPECGPKPTAAKAPPCNLKAPIPAVPTKPTCTPPQIPAMPTKPTCEVKTDLLGGNILIWAAAGAAGLYLLAKKK